MGNYTFLLKFPGFLKKSEIFRLFPKFFEITISEMSEIRNLDFVTSELDSESLSTLRKIIFKRDSCKVDVVAAPVITSCAKMAKCQFQKNSESQKVFQTISESQIISKIISESQKISKTISESQKVFQNISESQKISKTISESQNVFQKISESQCTSKCLSPSSCA